MSDRYDSARKGWGSFLGGIPPEGFAPDSHDNSLEDERGQQRGWMTGQAQGAQGRSAPVASAANAGGPALSRGPDFQQSDQTRGQMMSLADQLRSTSMGQGPSGAKLAADAQRDSALTQAAALQAGRRGQSSVAGAQMAQQAATMGGQQAAQTEAIGRAGEMAQARGELGGVLSGMRGQDLSAAGMGLQNNQFNAGQTQQGSQFNAGLQQQTNLANQGAQLSQQGMNDQYALGMGGMGLGANQWEQQRKDQLAASQYGWGDFFGDALGAGATLGAAALSDVNSKHDVQPVRRGALAGLGSAMKFLSDAYLAHSLEKGDKDKEALKDRKKTSEEYNAALKRGGLGYEPHRTETVLPTPPPNQFVAGPGQPPAPAYQPEQPVRNQFVAEPLYPQTQPVYSDERSKGMKRRAHDMMDTLTPYSYEYKPDARAAGMPGGRQLGVMWQDLMKTPAGREMDGGVDPQSGYHQVDYGKGLSTMMASIVDLNDRLSRFERKRRK